MHLNEPPVRRRALRAEVAQRREAMAALLPISEQIGPWQMQAARLLGYAQRLHGVGSSAPNIAEEAEALHVAVTAQQRRLNELLATLPPEIAGNSRVLDTEKALQSLNGSLQGVLLLMGEAKA